MIRLNREENWQIPNLSDNLRSKADSYETRLSKDYPLLDYQSFVLVPDGFRLIIDDVSFSGKRQYSVDECIDQLSRACIGTTCVVGISELTNSLEDQLLKMFPSVKTRNKVSLFPGSGAEVVKKSLSDEFNQMFDSISFSAERIIDESGRVVGVRTDVESVSIDPRFEMVMIVDDVIATGSTAIWSRRLCFPQGPIFMTSALMMLSPIQNRQYSQNRGEVGGAAIIDFDRVYAPVVYQGQSGIPPVNSLSTLIASSEKGELVRRRYLQKFVTDQSGFQQAVRQLQVDN